MTGQKLVEQTIEMLSHLLGELEAEAFEQEGFSDLSMRQMLYLETITQLKAPSFGDLAEKLNVSKPSVTTIVQKLIRMGYVKKVQSAEDRRVFRIVLTPKGESFDEIHGDVHRLLANRITKNLNEEELKQMTILLKKVMDG